MIDKDKLKYIKEGDLILVLIRDDLTCSSSFSKQFDKKIWLEVIARVNDSDPSIFFVVNVLHFSNPYGILDKRLVKIWNLDHKKIGIKYDIAYPEMIYGWRKRACKFC